jgi:hypothetical protein
MTTLTQDEQELLRHAVTAHNRRLLHVLSEIGQRPLTTDEREELRGALADELTAAGLDAEDEPTPYGLELENVIDALGHC